MKFHHPGLLLLPFLVAASTAEEADGASSCVAIRTETIGDCQFLDDP
eukprot:CAMPEP_0119546998 /NCGR_PEP_ID=MMETSP1352-20130426/1222_1 /TAXON_ID=265584 /ORGANISM="Stauroneis constricta, Strain CCMP1120" /LENGTH=46 /DNA_ID= /DNA_START= /DNA_END= /DNA_ORIENTATION=